ncbi:hypothetical protein PLICRDRAFT_40439 [Plicaturopsis crispa FD-325 SS-3]|nr:hypothetical protein PLICRDRAFT_40439 [Plicaturopsis crispa FD-325 SS-3]
MPSFLSKVFGRKKQDDKDSDEPTTPPRKRASDPSLLEGKFERISPSVSPSATQFVDAAAQVRGSKEHRPTDGGSPFPTLSLLRSVSRSKSPIPLSPKSTEELPHLSLNLPGPKGSDDNSRALGAVFEADPDSRIILDDSVIGARRLNPLETLVLVRACSQAIVSRGLETLGIMHPHWYSASPDIQRKLISLFIQSLAPNSRITTLSPTPSSPASAFESEINFTRSPQDVAAVLRWGLRHLKLDGTGLGSHDGWYEAFAEAERKAAYPLSAFSDSLVPLLPPVHVELLKTTLETVSSLAAHAEHNGISGSKLTKVLGLWLLTIDRSETSDDWKSFYARWERAGRILEHLFLARIRDETADHRLPTRLLELVKRYPYAKEPEDGLLARPRFSTRRYPALFVHVETELPSESSENKRRHPLRLIAAAFKAQITAEGEHVATWDKVKSASAGEGADGEDSSPVLSRVFADETIRLLSLIPAESSTSTENSPIITLFTPTIPRASRRRSFSFSDATPRLSPVAPSPTTNGNGASHVKTHSTTTSPPPSAFYATDWAQFSTTGFGEDSPQPLAATLLDQDVEVTQPQPSRKSSRKRKPTSRRSSVDNPTSPVSPSTDVVDTAKPVPKTTQVSLVELDEAFIDFWSDALLDPISATFPAFVICKLKSQSPTSSPASPGTDQPDAHVSWLIIEEKFVRPPPTPSSALHSPVESSKGRPTSPRPSLRSERISSTFSSARKRFSFFSGSKGPSSNGVEKETTKGRRKAPPAVGEMGEILDEDEGKQKAESKPVPKQTNGLGIVAAAAPAAVDPTQVPIPEEAAPSDSPTVDPTPAADVATPDSAAPEPVVVPAAQPELEAPSSPVASDHTAVPDEKQDTEAVPLAVPTAPAPAVEVSEPEESAPEQPPSPELQVQEPAEPELLVKAPTDVDAALPAEESPAPQDEPASDSTPSPVVLEETPAPEVVEESPASEVVEESPVPEVVEESPAPEVVEESPAPEVVEESPPSPPGSEPIQIVVEPDSSETSEEQPLEVEPSTPGVVAPEDESEALPAAPESVVLSGETPGPQIALETSEPVAVAEANAEVEADAEAEAEVSPANEHPEHVVDDSAVRELEPVPIVETVPEPADAHATLSDAPEVSAAANTEEPSEPAVQSSEVPTEAHPDVVDEAEHPNASSAPTDAEPEVAGVEEPTAQAPVVEEAAPVVEPSQVEAPEEDAPAPPEAEVPSASNGHAETTSEEKPEPSATISPEIVHDEIDDQNVSTEPAAPAEVASEGKEDTTDDSSPLAETTTKPAEGDVAESDS